MLNWMPPFSSLAETTWGFPILSALHVLGLAWFGGTVLLPGELARLKRWGLAFMAATGAALFLMQPARYAHSAAFWIKVLLIVAVVVPRRIGLWATVGLWFAVICAARAIAYF
ncbi:MAG: hypothetical protein JO307_12640 [Bryobacterales bacterium]|nr:hypothetical protein [Bryobacterales bacterium]MBV9399965.1 hypothetical protein [Bryobacterales bacterium]